MAHAITKLALPGDPCTCGNPACGLQVLVLDPACGAGMFLITAARRIATVYASLLSGRDDPPQEAIRFALPVVMETCVFGIDIDPVAVEIARAACWLEIDGTRPITWLDDNISAGDTLAGGLPDRLTERLDGPQPLAIIGNPPYRDKAGGAAPWVEARRRGELLAARPSLDEFRTPGHGRIEYSLSSLYVYFWRWALWRAFETRAAPGAVGFVSPSSYLTGKAFGAMRSYIRDLADEVWIIDLSPEGHQPPVSTRVFRSVQQRLCIGVATRGPLIDSDVTRRRA